MDHATTGNAKNEEGEPLSPKKGSAGRDTSPRQKEKMNWQDKESG